METIGQPIDSPLAVKSEEEILKNFSAPNWRFSDEENFQDLKSRALTALQFLADRKEDNILVVTHGFFLRILMACAVFGEELTGRECEKFIQTFWMVNTGLTIFSYNESDIRHWRIPVWNDHAHLG